MKLVALSLLALVVQSSSETAYEASVSSLRAGDAAAAEASAREALASSLAFSPEQELEARPDKGILFEDMILRARESYRQKRTRYFRALGDALVARQEWRAARKAYRRATALAPDAAIFTAMADHPDLTLAERVDLLLDAYLTPGSDRAALEQVLLDTGVFRSRNALKSSLDEKRFQALSAEYPALEWLSGAFPAFQAVTDAGTINTAELFQQGHLLLVYYPVDSCAHCSEQLDGLTLPVLEAKRREQPVTLTAFVPEIELPATRRIVRLLGMQLGVGRLEGLGSSVRFADTGEIRVVARGGMTQIRLPMSPDIGSAEIRREIEAVFGFLGAPGFPTEEKPEEASVSLVTFEKAINEERMLLDWIDIVRKLEVGPAPLSDLYERLRSQTQRLVRASEDRELVFEIMTALGGLEGANAAKTRTLAALGADIGDRLLDEVRSIDPDVKRTAPPGQGVFHVAVATDGAGGGRHLLLQRSFQSADGLKHYNFLLEDSGSDLSMRFVSAEPHEPAGVTPLGEGAAFHYAAEDGCRGVRRVRDGTIDYEGCDGAILDGELVEVKPALVDAVEGGPVFYRRDLLADAAESDLERGLRLFGASEFAPAAEAFEAAADAIDPVAPYDASDLLYNRARALEELGERQKALSIYRSIGDVSYQRWVNQGAGRIEGAPR